MQEVAQQVRPGFWADVRAAIGGAHHYDYTSGPLGRAILLLAIPMVLEMIMESLFGVVDMFFVAHLGADAAATVGLTESMVVMVFAVAMGLSMATTATVARRIGEKDNEGAAVSAVQSIILGIITGVIIGVIGFWNAPKLLELMGASPSIVATGSRYTSIYLGASANIMLLFLMNAIFRGAGDASIAMRTLWISNAINMVLDPCLILGLGPFPAMGVTGAATATTFGRGLGVVYQFWMLFGGYSRIRISRAQLRIDPVIIRKMLRIGTNGMFQFLIATASWVGLVRLVSMFGSNALAGYTVAMKIVVFAILPSWGLCNAAATMVGQNLGAGRPERAEAAVWKTGQFNMIFLGGVAIVFITFARPLVAIFTDDSAVAEHAVECLRYVSSGYIAYAWGMVMVQAFNGAGDTRTPTLINLACYWLWQIPLAYMLALYWKLGPRGAFLAIAIAESTIACAGIIAFRSGRWKKQKI